MKLIFSISFIIIAVILFFTVFDPTYGDVKQLKSEVTAYNIALDNSTELQRIKDSLMDVYKNIKKENKERLEHFLPSTISNIELILEIEKIANLHGLPIKDFKFDSKASQAQDSGNAAGTDNVGVIIAEEDPENYLPYGVFPMEFTVEGRYDTFMLFLKDLEYNLRLVDIKSIDISTSLTKDNSGSNETKTNGIYAYSLKIETYWLK